ncbi:conserved Plasmodium protein, unknown function [Plasmodium malariae]|uniref:WD repeat-containing protein n=1 Tax=Plasmodium malariae TaxID=5858 RepID=A0A1A8WEV3_PLAMA|nr:conserved Plasmodium protein, unknown function [Plasmodium malariae]
MTEAWKSTILYRLKQRNISQSENYQDVLASYNSLVDEKNKLLAIIASFTSENIYLLNNSKFSLSFESKILMENNLKKNDDPLTDECTKKKDNDYHNPLNNLKINILGTPAFDISQNDCQNLISKKEFLEVIKQKGKNDELILLLKNSLNEKEKLLNITNKENKTLHNGIIKREEELFEKKKELFKLEESLNKKEQVIKLYENNNKLLQSKIDLKDRRNAKLMREYDNIRLAYFKLLKQVYEMKNYKIKMDKEYFALRNVLFKKKVENENLLKYLLTCKKSYKRQLKKIEYSMNKRMRKKVGNNVHRTKKEYKSKHIFFKKQKFRVYLYLDKLHYVHNTKQPLAEKEEIDYTDDPLTYTNNDNMKTYSRDKYSTEEELDGKNYHDPRNNKRISYSSKLLSNSVLKIKEHMKNRNNPYEENSLKSKVIEAYPTSTYSRNIKRNEGFFKIKKFLNVHTSSSILCFCTTPKTDIRDSLEYLTNSKNRVETKMRMLNLNGDSKFYNLRMSNDVNGIITTDSENNDNKNNSRNRNNARNSDSYIDSNSDCGINRNSNSNTQMIRQCFVQNEVLIKNCDQEEPYHNMVVTCGEDGKIAFIYVKENKLKCVKCFYILNSKIPAYNICIHPSRLYSVAAMANNNICLINNVKSKVEHSYYGHKEKITSVNFLNDFIYTDEKSLHNYLTDYSLFYSTSVDGTIKFWNMKKNCCYNTIHVNNLITCSAISNYGSHVLIGTHSGSVICYDIRVHNKSLCNSILYDKKLFNEKIYGLNYSPDDQLIAIQSVSGKLKLLNANKINFLQSFENPKNDLTYQTPKSYPIFSLDGKKLICSYPYNIVSYDILTHSYFNIINNQLGEINGTNCILNDKLLTIHSDGNIAIW